MSSGSRSGYSTMISPTVIPLAIRLTMRETEMRMPRMQALPPKICGSAVIRSKPNIAASCRRYPIIVTCSRIFVRRDYAIIRRAKLACTHTRTFHALEGEPMPEVTGPNLELTEEHKMIRDTARDFAQKEIAPIAAHHDETGEFPLATIKKMGALGLMGVEVPEEYGGAGMDTL